MTLAVLSCIVEGQGEVGAVPLLLRRLAFALDPLLTVEIPRPIRVPKSRLLRGGECERYVRLAGDAVTSRGGVLILVDADDDCPAELGPDLLERAISTRSPAAIGVVIAKKEFENWFIADVESLAGKRQLSADITSPERPEEIRGAKEWLSQRMIAGSYSPTVDQPALAAGLNIQRTRVKSASFDKLYREVGRLLLQGAST